MSKIFGSTLPSTRAEIECGPWGRLLTQQPSYRPRRSIGIRLASAQRALASLRMSERNERQMLQQATFKLEKFIATGTRLRSLSFAEAQLDVQTHRSNLIIIERQIALVRLAIEHLNRRTSGWGSKPEKDGSRFDRRTQQETEVNDYVKTGLEAVRAIRAERGRKLTVGIDL